MSLFNRKSNQEKKQQELEQLIPIGEGLPEQAQEVPQEKPKTNLADAFVGEKPSISDPISVYRAGEMDVVNLIAPNQIDKDFNYIKINDVYLRTLFISGYPRFVAPGWLEQIINFNSSLDISFFIYPVKGKDVLDDLMRKIAEMEAEISTDIERGKIVNPSTEAKLEDARRMQEELVKGIEHVYEFSFYVTIRAADLEQLNHITKQVESTLGSILLTAKHASLDMESGFLSTAPTGLDLLSITRNMDTTSLATMFPLTSAELSSDRGVLYGINSQNGSFIIFDRFSMENSNMAVFATSGAGKSLANYEVVLYQDLEGRVRLNKIGKVVKNIIENGELKRFDEESEGVINPGIKVFSFDKDFKAKWSDVTVAARKISPATHYKITTKSGRQITTTGDHNFVVLKDGGIKILRGDSINEGTYLPLPRKVDQFSIDNKFLNVDELFQKANIPYRKLSGNRLKSTARGAKNTIPSQIPLNKDFFTLFGLFAAEGSISSKKALITSEVPCALEIIKKFYSSLEVAYGFHKNGSKITGIYVATSLFCKLLIELSVSGKAHAKRVPSLVFSASNQRVADFLRGYYEGDGGVDGHEISATTKSKRLASDLCYLLLRFGIIGRIGITRKFTSNTLNKTVRTYYRVRISGQDNIQKFIKEIGFLSERKNTMAKKLLKKGNTNTDVIPEIGTIFKEIYPVLYNSEIPAPKTFSEIKLGIFKPSPNQLSKVISHIEKRIEEIEDLEKDGLGTLRSLPTLGDILEKRNQREINTLLWKKLNKSWWTMTHNYPPKLANTLKAIAITHNREHAALDISGALYRSFKKTGESLQIYDKSLWDALINKKQNPLYQKVINARDYISEKHKQKMQKLNEVKKKVAWLKTLANADLYWDPIVKIEKIKSKHKYVYDLQVDNGVFLAGHGGMFIHNSYFVKLEALRSLMLGIELIIIDPENEYKAMCDAVGGEYITFAFNSPSKINPFDLSGVYEEGENQLGLKILSLHGLFKVIMGDLSPTQEAVLDRAIVATYKSKGITQDPATQKREPPLMEDLYKILIGMETAEALDLASRIERFVRGGFVGIFDAQTNFDIQNPFTVFSLRDMQDALRPIAMYIILDFIWTRVKKDLKPRLLIVDEAWYMMRYKESALFLWGIVKRARKYYLGLTTIAQDIEDFLNQDIGKAIVTNSALRVLFKQSPAAIDRMAEVFYLSQGEKQLLLGATVGQGIFFAGNNHAPIYVVASPEEHKLATTKPQEVMAQKETQPRLPEQPAPGMVAEITQRMGDSR